MRPFGEGVHYYHDCVVTIRLREFNDEVYTDGVPSCLGCQGWMLAMLTAAQLPLTYWGEAALTVGFLFDLILSSTLIKDVTQGSRSWKTPNLTFLIWRSGVCAVSLMFLTNFKWSWVPNHVNASSWATLQVSRLLSLLTHYKPFLWLRM